MSAPPKFKALAVIGTAGRGDDAPRINADLYAQMAGVLKGFIDQIGTPERLVSGGAAVADHLAVGFFLKGLVSALSLHLPASFSHSTGGFVEPYEKCAGSITNHWHCKFSRACGGNSLRALAGALSRPGCTVHNHLGFDPRNGGIADEADAVIAFTFGAGPALKAGGSWNTMQLCLKRGIPAWHVDLNTMTLHYLNAMPLRSPVARAPAATSQLAR